MLYSILPGAVQSRDLITTKPPLKGGLVCFVILWEPVEYFLSVKVDGPGVPALEEGGVHLFKPLQECCGGSREAFRDRLIIGLKKVCQRDRVLVGV